jgi:UDP-N-acetylmuramate dehydrogenase
VASRSIDFSKYSSIKVGPVVDVEVIEQGDEIPDGHFLIGGANNLLLSDNPPPLMMLGKSYDFIEIEGESIIAGCALKTGRLLSFAKKHNIADFEFVAKLPGTLGGMLAMNAGVKSYEIFPLVQEIEINNRWVAAKDIEYGYRFAKLGGIATRVRLSLEKGYSESLKEELLNLRSNQPKEPSAGSAFKNPPNDYAGRLIEAVGLKGERRGDMAWSTMHANFLVNLGHGRYKDAQELIDLAKSRVEKEFGVLLKEEIKIV